MVEDTKESGLTIKCMVWANIPGEMDESIRDSINLTRNMVLDLTLGLTEENMSESGWIVRDMVKDELFQQKDIKERVFGSKTNEFVGLTRVVIWVHLI